MLFLIIFLCLVFILISVAFFTLLERKALGYVHIRIGPNKVGILGLFQPFGDAIKLFKKEDRFIIFGNLLFYVLAPFWGLILIFFLWGFYPFWGMNFHFFYGWVLFFIIVRITIFYLLISGWRSGGKFRKLGRYRCSAQSVSYEVGIIFLLLRILFSRMRFNYNVFFISIGKEEISFISFFYIIFLFLIFLAERIRSPFDFAEGESELVRGFNTEYIGGLFSLIFIGEYGFILFYRILICFLFISLIYVSFSIILFVFLFIWVRGSFPRLRYDYIIYGIWKILLPILFYIFFILLEENLF